MFRKLMTLGMITVVVLVLSVMAACSTDDESVSTNTAIPAAKPTSIPTSTVAPDPAPSIAVTGAWGRPAAMIVAEDATMSGMDMSGDSMSVSDNEDAMSGMDMGGDSMSMGDDNDTMSGMDGKSMPMGGTGAVYFTMTNSGDADDKLVEVLGLKVESEGDLSDMVELHETTMTDGVMKMEKLESGIEVAAGDSVELKPGGLHVMFMNIKRDLVPGDEVTLVLRFESGVEQTIVAEVREP
jgi:copper(I)-binding protein